MKHLLIFIQKDFWEASSYRTAFLIKIFKILFTVTIFFYFSKFVKQDIIKEYTLFQYIFSGHIFYEFLIKYLKTPSSKLMTEQYIGTLEFLFNAKLKPYKVLLFSMAYGFIIDLLMLAIYLTAGVALFNLSINLNIIVLLQFFLVLIISLIYLLSLGFIGAAVTLILKKSDPFTSGIKYFFLLAGGIYFPANLLPEWLLFIGKLFPVTDSIDLIRDIFYNGNFEINRLLYISLHAFILFPISIFIFNLSLKKVKRDNLLSIY